MLLCLTRSSILRLTSNCAPDITGLGEQFLSRFSTGFCSQHRFEFTQRRTFSGEHKNMDTKKRIAVCQMTSTGDRVKNMETVATLIEKAVKENVQMVFFPEACDYLCDNKKDMLNFAEPIVGGNTVNQYRDLAKRHNMWLSMGGLHEKDPENEKKVFNTHIIINSDGEIVQTYRKLHLFDVEIPEKGVRLKESDYATAGNDIVVPVKTPVGAVGLAICYDMRFPELASQLTSLGADIITFPSAFTYATGKAHWDILLRCRAIENQCYVVAAAQVGHHNAKRRSFGHAQCVDPWGEVLATCGDREDAPSIAVAEVDTLKVKDVRRNMPVQQHKRTDLYKIIAPRIRFDQLPEHIISTTTAPVEIPSVEETIDTETKHFNFSDIKVRASTVFYETEFCYAFVNIRCVVPGHVLVASKRVAKRTTDLTPEEMCDFFQTVVKVQKVMEKVHSVTSTTITVQDGREAGQTVEHVHCHIMPRRRGDFKDMDMIYLELAKHDARPLNTLLPSKPARTLRDMREEAALLRSHFTDGKQT